MASALYKAQTPNGAQSKQNPWFLLQTCPGRPPISVQAAASSGAQALPPAVPPAGSFSRHRQHPQHLPCPSPAPGRQPGPLCCTPVPNPQIPFNSVNHCPLCSELPVVSCFSQSKSQPSYNGLKAQRPCQPLSRVPYPSQASWAHPCQGLGASGKFLPHGPESARRSWLSSPLSSLWLPSQDSSQRDTRLAFSPVSLPRPSPKRPRP